MKFDKKSLLLYAVTDRSWLGTDTLAKQVEMALKGGATFVQRGAGGKSTVQKI